MTEKTTKKPAAKAEAPKTKFVDNTAATPAKPKGAKETRKQISEGLVQVDYS